MNVGAKEKRFLDELETLFTGAEVEGDSGFVNLMRMKRNYFRSIRLKLMVEIDQRAEKESSFREELFDKLYTFFHRYFCESGSIYFRHLPAFSKTYERVYADGQDVALSWKTRMLYYVKSDVLVRSMPVELNEEGKPQNTRRFYFDASEFEQKKNNEKREFVFNFEEVKRESQGRVVHLKVAYSRQSTRTRIDEILKKARTGGVRLSEEQLQRAIGVFRRQTEADFFINKDARGFLREQFELWMYQYLFHEETIFEQERLDQLRAIQQTAYDIIDFIAQFEDELRRVWEKPKFARDVNYVVTLDRVTDAVLKKITRHKGATAQLREWKKLGMVEDRFSMKDVFKGQKRLDNKNGANGNYRFLPLDTKHFKDLELEILDGLGNLDEALDGELVHSENWQALNTLQERYRGRVKCIYIDPPYNTGKNDFLYKDNGQHASWLQMMHDRISIGRALLKKDGFFTSHIDENEYENMQKILLRIFGKHVLNSIIWNKLNPKGDALGIATQHEFICCSSKDREALDRHSLVKEKAHAKEILNKAKRIVKARGGVNSDARRQFKNWVNENRKLSGGESAYHCLDDNGDVYRLVSMAWPNRDPAPPEYFTPLVHPKTRKKCPVPGRGWRYAKNTMQKKVKEGRIIFGENESVQPREKYLLKERIHENLPSVMEYGGSDDALFKKMNLDVESINKLTHKPVEVARRLLSSFSREPGSTVVDYFAGSGTTAHAVINLNREDGGSRKYLLVEMGEYFHTVLLPRIKKVVYSKDWKDGKPVSREGSSHFLKYYSLEQYEETLRNSRYEDDGEQLELDTQKSPFEQYVFFCDDKLAHAVKPLKNGKLKINLRNLYPDVDVAESLSNVLGKQIRKRAADSVTFEDGSTEKTNPAKMTKEEQQHFVALIKPYLWWGE